MAEIDIPAQQRDQVLAYLGVKAGEPSAGLLAALIGRYVEKVPWESASRIAKRARTADPASCPRWPREFWDDAMRLGTGGTCFESNLAFWSVLESLGFEGYLTINNMQESIGCHTAIVVTMRDERWLVDAGYPIYAPLRLIPHSRSHSQTPWITFTATWVGDNRYEITRAPHPAPYCFTLINTPVDVNDYLAATTGDYGPDGLFLDGLIVNKVVNDQLWRFSSAEAPPALLLFENGSRTDHAITGDVAAQVSVHFGIHVDVIRAAFAALAE